MAEPAWVSTERAQAAEPSSPTAPYTERMPTPPQPSIKEEEGMMSLTHPHCVYAAVHFIEITATFTDVCQHLSEKTLCW